MPRCARARLCRGLLRRRFLDGSRSRHPTSVGASDGLHNAIFPRNRREASPGPRRSAAIAEMTLDLAEDVRHGERRQLDAPFGLIPVDGLDQADSPDLNEILQLLSPMHVTPRERLDERELFFDQPLSQLEVAVVRGACAHPRIYFRDFLSDLQSHG